VLDETANGTERTNRRQPGVLGGLVVLGFGLSAHNSAQPGVWTRLVLDGKRNMVLSPKHLSNIIRYL
jgi:hypothetical protein